MWANKKEWGALVQRVNLIETVLKAVEQDANMCVMTGTSGWGPSWFIGTTVGNNMWASVNDVLRAVMEKLNLHVSRKYTLEGVLTLAIESSVENASGGTTGRAKDGRFSKKG